MVKGGTRRTNKNKTQTHALKSLCWSQHCNGCMAARMLPMPSSINHSKNRPVTFDGAVARSATCADVAGRCSAVKGVPTATAVPLWVKLTPAGMCEKVTLTVALVGHTTGVRRTVDSVSSQLTKMGVDTTDATGAVLTVSSGVVGDRLALCALEQRVGET